jgi:putative oxidoreductase
VSNALARFDQTVVTLARHYGVLTLRIALGVVFIWFGALKVADVSPVADLVADIVPILSDRAAVMTVGIVELVVGLGLIVGFAIRLTLGLFFAQMLGTFLVLVLRSGLSFQGGNPFRLTVLGEFVVKNLVLLTAGVVVAGSIPRPRRDENLAAFLKRPAAKDTEISAHDG